MDSRLYSPSLLNNETRDPIPLRRACSDLISDKKIVNCTISTLTHCKEKQTPYHEFILATVVINCHGKPCTTMKIERLVRSEDLSKFSSNSSRAPPQDVVSVGSVAGGLGCIFEIVETVAFPSLPLCDFSRLLPLVTIVGEHYQILKHQCYWFCWIIKEAAIQLWRGKAVVGTAKRQEGGYGSVSKRLGRDRASLDKLLELYKKGGMGARQSMSAPMSVAELEATLEMRKREVENIQAQIEYIRAQGPK